jgi:hypothetical protein
MREIASLLHIQEVIDALKAVDLTTLTEPEREAVQDSLQQAYDRAAFLLQRNAKVSFSRRHLYVTSPQERLKSDPFPDVINHSRLQRGSGVMQH